MLERTQGQGSQKALFCYGLVWIVIYCMYIDLLVHGGAGGPVEHRLHIRHVSPMGVLCTVQVLYV